jgi:hypothetical protein
MPADPKPAPRKRPQPRGKAAAKPAAEATPETPVEAPAEPDLAAGAAAAIDAKDDRDAAKAQRKAERENRDASRAEKKAEREKRDAEIVRLYNDGNTLAKITEAVGTTSGTVRKALYKSGTLAEGEKFGEKQRAEKRDKILAAFAENDGKLKETGLAIGVPTATVYHVVKAAGLMAGRSRASRKIVLEPETVEALTEIATSYGTSIDGLARAYKRQATA